MPNACAGGSVTGAVHPTNIKGNIIKLIHPFLKQPLVQSLYETHESIPFYLLHTHVVFSFLVIRERNDRISVYSISQLTQKSRV